MEELDLKEYLKYILQQMSIVVLSILLVVIVGSIYTLCIKVPMYKTYTTLVLTAEQDNKTITQNDLTINKNLVTTYSQIIKSKKIMKKVISNLSLDCTVEQLENIINITSLNDTEIIKITVINEEAELASSIANEVAKVFTEEIVGIYKIENISNLDAAEVPNEAYNMNYIKDYLLYFICGTVLGIIMVTIKFYFDNGIKSTEQLETKFKLPMLGTIINRNNRKGKKVKEYKSEIIVSEDPKSIVSEGFRTLRTNLQFSSVDKELKSILVTSSIPGEGKSFVSANLAAAFAQNGNRVLLVDCDMRKGRQHFIFDIKNDNGLSKLLISNSEISYNQFFNKTSIRNLFLLTMGAIPPNPSELLGSNKNKKLTQILAEHFDIVIYDGVPTNGLPDSLVMSKLVDKVVVVTELKNTPIELLENTIKSLEKVNADVAGIVVNKVPATNKGTYSTYGGYYN